MSVPNLIAGETYYTDIQLYDENWDFICEDKQAIEIIGDSEPCDTSICQGDVVLQTQAEVDAFCGCEVIEGSLFIVNGDDTNNLAFINSLASLRTLKRVNGNINISNITTTSISDLSNLNYIGSTLIIANNPNLTNVNGLENLRFIGELLISSNNPNLSNMSALSGLKQLNSLVLASSGINDISFLNNLEVTALNRLEITNCDNLTSLNGLEGITAITNDNINVCSFFVAGNDNLLSLEGIKNITSVNGDFVLRGNTSLSDCCSIVHLVDNDSQNGNISGTIEIRDNTNFCNSPEAILQACQTPPPLCENVQITLNNNQIIVDGLTAPNEIIKVFDENFNIVFQCIANCEEQQIKGNFPAGTYIVDLQLYDDNWAFICAEQRTIILDNSNPCNTADCETTPPVLTNIPADITVECDAIPSNSINITATDNCDTNVEIEFSEARTNSSCEDGFVLTRTWTATDNCGNTTTAQQIITIIQEGNNLCDNIAISTTNDAITLSNIDAPNAIVKVFDATYQIIYECTATCESELIVPIMGTGIYHTDVQFYDAQWAFICENRQDIEVIDGGKPCDVSICQGDVTLSTQAEVDAFCGCEVIEGNLTIGKDSINFLTDITTIETLQQLREVKGAFAIVRTSITDLSPLSNLVSIDGSFAIVRNNGLKNYEGLANLIRVGNLVAIGNQNLENLIGISSRLEIHNNLQLANNSNLTTLTALVNIRQLQFLEINDNDRLLSLNGLENVELIEANPDLANGISIVENELLNDISALQNLNIIFGFFRIINNPSLQDCCPILHLIDDDTENGQVTGTIPIGSNAVGFCNRREDIIENCQMPSSSLCMNINIQTANNNITIANLTAPIEIVKVFDNNYAPVHQCFADCEETINLSDLAAGTYHISLNAYDEDWTPICERTESVEVGGNAQDRNTDFSPVDFALFPNPARTEAFIDLSKVKGEKVELVLYNQFGQAVMQQIIEEVAEQGITLDLSATQNGLYVLKIKSKNRKAVAKKLLVSRLY